MKNDSNTSESGVKRTFWVVVGGVMGSKGGVRKFEGKLVLNWEKVETRGG